MEDAAREAVADNLVRDSGARLDSIEIVRQKRAGDRLTALAYWTEARTGRTRRGAVDLAMTDRGWRGGGGWSTDANHDSGHPVWRAWGGSSHSTSGWVADPAAFTVRFRDPHDRVEVDTVENGVVILMYDPAFDRASVVEVLDSDGNVLHVAPIA